ncbi:hypothetical protein [Paraburkholderia dilworthii]|uniref:hypothetical protein n=1 Tax=Paraburkholderia dilworthii TaxID=948106 RepID=UPI0004012BDE|nr:hypothetical protein [Paraburkholderia dilworthii]
MLELIEILHTGLPLSEPRSWLLIATVLAACVAGWYSGDVAAWYASRNKDAE